jgi:hypothetical protein
MVEADQRFLKAAPEFWPVFVIVTTDNGESYREPDVPTYNAFMNDLRARAGAVHAVIIQGRRTGPVSVFITNLTDNVAGSLGIINTDNSLSARLREIANAWPPITTRCADATKWLSRVIRGSSSRSSRSPSPARAPAC